MSTIIIHDINDWEPTNYQHTNLQLLEQLENGKVLFFPKLSFTIDKKQHILLNPDCLQPRTKNVSYNPNTEMLKGVKNGYQYDQALQQLLKSYCKRSTQFIKLCFPHYAAHLQIGRTSFRPAEIAGRKTSYRKDDTRLHVDAFTSMPIHGKRILRLFSNINPTIARRWHLGEPYHQVMQRFLPSIKKPIFGMHEILKWFGVTKTKRSLYDHFMLNIHNNMKNDHDYQKNAVSERFDFPAHSSWLVFTDLVSHAAISGQHLLEQTFYINADQQRYPKLSPLKQLENFLNTTLVK